jgi:hypothetical protein
MLYTNSRGVLRTALDGPIDISACETDEVEKALGIEPAPEEESDDEFD